MVEEEVLLTVVVVIVIFILGVIGFHFLIFLRCLEVGFYTLNTRRRSKNITPHHWSSPPFGLATRCHRNIFFIFDMVKLSLEEPFRCLHNIFILSKRSSSLGGGGTLKISNSKSEGTSLINIWLLPFPRVVGLRSPSINSPVKARRCFEYHSRCRLGWVIRLALSKFKFGLLCKRTVLVTLTKDQSGPPFWGNCYSINTRKPSKVLSMCCNWVHRTSIPPLSDEERVEYINNW